jgi:hypothetical protein
MAPYALVTPSVAALMMIEHIGSLALRIRAIFHPEHMTVRRTLDVKHAGEHQRSSREQPANSKRNDHAPLRRQNLLHVHLNAGVRLEFLLVAVSVCHDLFSCNKIH